MTGGTLGERLRDARRRIGWSQSELSRRSGIGQSTLSKLENNTQGSTLDVAVLASVLGVDALWLSTGKTSSLKSLHDKRAQGPRTGDTVSANSTVHKDDVMLYQYADPRCPVGINSGNYEKPELPTITVSYVTLRDLEVTPDESVAYIHNDASMGATVAPGDECIIRIDQPSVDEWNGRLFAIASGERVSIRRIVSRASGGYLVSCDTTDKIRFPDELLSQSEAQSLNIIGRLCWSSGHK